MNTTTREWAYLLLWPNFAVATVVLVLVAVDRISTFRDLLTIAAYALTYSNLVALVGLLLFSWPGERAGSPSAGCAWFRRSRSASRWSFLWAA